jgi:hypothetical protein
VSFFGTRPGYSTSIEASLLTALNNLTAGGTGTAIQKTNSGFVNVSLASGQVVNYLTIQVNGALFTTQSTINFIAGSNVVLADNGNGRLIISLAPGAGSGSVTSVGIATANGVSGSGAITTSGNITITLGAITPTSVNGLTINTTTGVLAIANAKTLTLSNSLTFTGTDTSSVAFGTGGTVLYSGGALGTPASGNLSNCTGYVGTSALVIVGTITTGGLGTGAVIAGVTMSLGSDAVGDMYAATTSNVLSRIAAVAVGQVLISKGVTTLPTWSASPTVSNILTTSNAITCSGNAATVPVTSKISTVTNNSAGTFAITITTTGAIDGQLLIVRILDFSGVAQMIGWTNTENSTVTAPTTSNGSTTLPLTVGFQFNTNTTKWRCIASA